MSNKQHFCAIPTCGYVNGSKCQCFETKLQKQIMPIRLFKPCAFIEQYQLKSVCICLTVYTFSFFLLILISFAVPLDELTALQGDLQFLVGVPVLLCVDLFARVLDQSPREGKTHYCLHQVITMFKPARAHVILSSNTDQVIIIKKKDPRIFMYLFC